MNDKQQWFNEAIETIDGMNSEEFKKFIDECKPLSYEDEKLLSDNLWDLYQSDTHQPPLTKIFAYNHHSGSYRLLTNHAQTPRDTIDAKTRLETGEQLRSYFGDMSYGECVECMGNLFKYGKEVNNTVMSCRLGIWALTGKGVFDGEVSVLAPLTQIDLIKSKGQQK